MMKHLGAVIVAAVMLIAPAQPIAHAQPPAPASSQQAAVLADLEKSIVRAIGAQPNTVAISQAGNIFVVARVNSNMNEASHRARDNEATAIASIVSKEISSKPEFKNVNTIRVQYLIRSEPSAGDKVIDTVDFRKDPTGAFQFHRT
jgi:hypothetical protein